MEVCVYCILLGMKHVLSMWVWVAVSDFPEKATSNNHSLHSSQFPILPPNKLEVYSMAKSIVAFPRFW